MLPTNKIHEVCFTQIAMTNRTSILRFSQFDSFYT